MRRGVLSSGTAIVARRLRQIAHPRLDCEMPPTGCCGRAPCAVRRARRPAHGRNSSVCKPSADAAYLSPPRTTCACSRPERTILEWYEGVAVPRRPTAGSSRSSPLGLNARRGGDQLLCTLACSFETNSAITLACEFDGLQMNYVRTDRVWILVPYSHANGGGHSISSSVEASCNPVTSFF
jgi:hypothetical protein